MEIAEDAEEDMKSQSTVPEERPVTPKDIAMSCPQVPQSSSPSILQSPDLSSTNQSRVTGSEITTTLSYRSQQISNDGPGSPTKSFDGRRKSSQSTRPENYSYSLYGSNGKPKVKLGPRPSIDTNGRPHTSASVNYRPISTLPAGLKLFSSSKRQKEQFHEQSGTAKVQHPIATPTMTVTPPIDVLDMSRQTVILTRPHTSGGQPASSATPVKAPTSPMIVTPKMPALTPEKVRLLKALEMRKKQKSAISQADSTLPAIAGTHPTPPIVESLVLDSTSHVTEYTPSQPSYMLKTDSAIAIEALPVGISAESDTTRTNSNPASPLEPSEESHSTRASSVSDLTDETVQDQNGSQSNASVELATPVEMADPLETYVKEPVKYVPKMKSEKTKDDFVQVPDVQNSSGGGDKGYVSSSSTETSSATYNVLSEMADNSTSLEDASDRKGPMVDEMSAITRKDKMQSHRDNLGGNGDSGLGVENEIQKIAQGTAGRAFPATLMEVERTEIINALPEAHQTPKSPIRDSKIPRSKFSVQDLKSEAAKTSSAPDAPSTFDVIAFNDTNHWNTEDEQESLRPPMKSKKRKGMIEPIRTDVGASERSEQNSETELSSDDDLMDELQSATVQEAKPISVSKSPINPVFPSQVRKATGEASLYSRAFSNPMGKDSSKNHLLSPHTPSDTPRSVSSSAAFPSHVDQQPTISIAKKVNLGSGISQRIKAFEKLSGSQNPPSGDTGPTQGSSASSILVRKPGNRGSKSPSIIKRAESLTQKNPSPSISRESSPEALKLRGRSESIQNRRETIKSPSTGQPQRSRPESISVTARIIRDPNQPFPSKPEMPKDALDYSPLDLKQSLLLIDHQKAVVIPQSSPKEPQEILPKGFKEERRERRSSITMVRDLIKERRTSFAERRKSMTIDTPTRSPAPSPSRTPHPPKRPLSVSSRRSNSSREFGPSLSPVGPPINSSPTNSEEAPEKKPGRATRILRRMSSSFSAGRKTIAHAISPTVREEFEPPQAERQTLSSSQASQPPLAPSVTVNVGDLNVQFPDTLLWKRRTMIIDSEGFLLLSQAHGSKVAERSTGLKKYHLSEFRTPFVPEMEAQELSNSVVLDFIGGSGLQVACEDRGGQLRVLQSTSLIVSPAIILPNKIFSSARSASVLDILRQIVKNEGMALREYIVQISIHFSEVSELQPDF